MKTTQSILLILSAFISFNTQTMDGEQPSAKPTYTQLKGEFQEACKNSTHAEALKKAAVLQEFFNNKNNQQAHALLAKHACRSKAILFGIGTLGFGALAAASLGADLLTWSFSFGEYKTSFLVPKGFAAAATVCLFKAIQQGTKHRLVTEENVFDAEKIWLTKHIKSLEPSVIDKELSNALKTKKD
ncbi:MAG: hypothetical protein AB7F19_03560 [Candidatus Babeliales bacterium]